jgi:CRP/FNR family transcriptional regulator
MGLRQRKEDAMAARLPKRGMGCKGCYNIDCCIFSGLDEEELSQVAPMIRLTPHARGEVIFHQGAPIFGYYILCQGKVKLARRTASGKRQVFQFYSPGDLIGGSVLQDAETHDVYAKALEDSLVGFIKKADFADLLRKYPQVSLEIIRRLSCELEILRKRLTDIAYRGVRERLIDLLLELGEEYGIKREDGLLVDLALTEQELAGMIGSSRQTVSQHLCKLAKRGLLSLEGHRITIIDKEGLDDLR